MLIMLYVKWNVHEISQWKTLQTFCFYSTKKLEDLLGTLKIWKEIIQLPNSCSVVSNKTYLNENMLLIYANIYRLFKIYIYMNFE